jgi:YqaJ-like viral recombinase domain
MIAPYSDAWWLARVGKITASERLFTAVYAGPRLKNNLLDELKRELQIGFVTRKPDNKFQAHGRQHEPKARALVELMYGVHTVDAGLLTHPQCEILAATPDYVVRSPPDGAPSTWAGPIYVVGEIKCPFFLKNHFIYNLSLGDLEAANARYWVQVQGQLAITGAPIAWFSTYHPDAEPGYQFFNYQISPDVHMHARMLESCAELADMLQRDVRYGVGRTVDRDNIPQLF